MFKLKVADSKLLRDMATAISILVDEATFKIEPDGLKLRAMDPSRVAMIDFEWPKTVFEEYICNEPTKMCINISELLKLLKRAGKDEAVELSLDEATGRQIVDLLFTKHAERGMTLVLVTHDHALAQRCDRVVRLRSGWIERPVAAHDAAS